MISALFSGWANQEPILPIQWNRVSDQQYGRSETLVCTDRTAFKLNDCIPVRTLAYSKTPFLGVLDVLKYLQRIQDSSKHPKSHLRMRQLQGALGTSRI